MSQRGSFSLNFQPCFVEVGIFSTVVTESLFSSLNLIQVFAFSRGCIGLFYLLGTVPHPKAALRSLLRVQMAIRRRRSLPANQRKTLLHHRLLLLLFLDRQPNPVQRYVSQVQVKKGKPKPSPITGPSTRCTYLNRIVKINYK